MGTVKLFVGIGIIAVVGVWYYAYNQVQDEMPEGEKKRPAIRDVNKKFVSDVKQGYGTAKDKVNDLLNGQTAVTKTA